MRPSCSRGVALLLSSEDTQHTHTLTAEVSHRTNSIKNNSEPRADAGEAMDPHLPPLAILLPFRGCTGWELKGKCGRRR